MNRSVPLGTRLAGLVLLLASATSESGSGPTTRSDRSNPLGRAGNVKSIVFVCDPSGPILDRVVGTLVRRGVDELKEDQSFNVVFAHGPDAAAFRPRPVNATAENRKKLSDFIADRGATHGETDPIPALDTAFRQRPDVVFLLTDGDFPDNDAVLKRVRLLNADLHAKVNTVAFMGEGDNDTALQSLLKRIAAESGGSFVEATTEDVR